MIAVRDVLPVVVRDAQGRLLAAALTNDKGFHKSLERNHLWVLHPETGRLIPWEYQGTEPPIMTLRRHDETKWVECAVAAVGLVELPVAPSAAMPPAQGAPPESRLTEVSPTPPAADLDGVGAVAEVGAATNVDADAETGVTTDVGAVIDHVATVIRERRRTMPEGSYTTHLFQKGEAKIRKKAGEEAIELLLARDRGELISEAADFIYHLLVLLEVNDTSMQAVARVLGERA